jgi:hypothetical protein
MGTNTTNLALYKPAVGETGWGALVNGNFDTLDAQDLLKADVAAPVFTGLVDLSDATAGQVKFPATQNPSADVHTLDDYEEGTWTPLVGGTATYTNQIGVYTKVGRLVTVSCNLTIATIGTGSQSIISGLPFPSNGTGGYNAISSPCYYTGIASSLVVLFARVVASSSLVTLYGTSVATTIHAPQNALTSSTTVMFTLTYMV